MLGLDVSTSIIGWCVISSTAKIGDLHTEWGHIDLTKIKFFWDKVDRSKNAISNIVDDLYDKGIKISSLYIEDPVKRFRSGASSAHTIALLAKFNCLISYFARQKLSIDPVYLDATAARLSLGINLVSKKKSGGKNQKQQSFDYLSSTVFKNYNWPITRTGRIQAYCYDQMDSYVIALSGAIITQNN